MKSQNAARRPGRSRTPAAAFVVKDSGGQKLAYVSYEEDRDGSRVIHRGTLKRCSAE